MPIKKPNPATSQSSIKNPTTISVNEEIKAKIIGGNVARLYGIDTDAKLKKIENDEFSQRRKEFLANQATYVGA
mgnify:CR=1 FL=1